MIGNTNSKGLVHSPEWLSKWGFKKGCAPWNKDKTKETEYGLFRISEFMKGKKYSKGSTHVMSEKNRIMQSEIMKFNLYHKGHRHSKKSRKAMSISARGRANKHPEHLIKLWSSQRRNSTRCEILVQESLVKHDEPFFSQVRVENLVTPDQILSN